MHVFFFQMVHVLNICGEKAVKDTGHVSSTFNTQSHHNFIQESNSNSDKLML